MVGIVKRNPTTSQKLRWRYPPYVSQSRLLEDLSVL